MVGFRLGAASEAGGRPPPPWDLGGGRPPSLFFWGAAGTPPTAWGVSTSMAGRRVMGPYQAVLGAGSLARSAGARWRGRRPLIALSLRLPSGQSLTPW